MYIVANLGKTYIQVLRTGSAQHQSISDVHVHVRFIVTVQFYTQTSYSVRVIYSYLSSGEMLEYFQELDPLLHSGDCSERSVDDILYHHLKVLDSTTILAVVIVPTRHLHIKDCLLYTLERGQVFLECVFNLFEAPGDLGPPTTSKGRYWPFLALKATGKVYLHVDDKVTIALYVRHLIHMCTCTWNEIGMNLLSNLAVCNDLGYANTYCSVLT